MKDQESALRKEPDIIIATPGRLVDHLHNTPSFGLHNIEILVLDEADRLENHFIDFFPLSPYLYFLLSCKEVLLLLLPIILLFVFYIANFQNQNDKKESCFN